MSKSIHDTRSLKPAGWFSRRHQTRDAHWEAVANYQAEHGRQARQEAAQGREEEIKGLAPTERLQALDDRLGAGVGAQRERARLAVQ